MARERDRGGAKGLDAFNGKREGKREREGVAGPDIECV